MSFVWRMMQLQERPIEGSNTQDSRLSRDEDAMGKPAGIQESLAQAQRHRGKTFFPFLVLGIGVSLSILLHFVIQDNVEGDANLRFKRKASDAKHVIEHRLSSYTDVIY